MAELLYGMRKHPDVAGLLAMASNGTNSESEKVDKDKVAQAFEVCVLLMLLLSTVEIWNVCWAETRCLRNLTGGARRGGGVRKVQRHTENSQGDRELPQAFSVLSVPFS